MVAEGRPSLVLRSHIPDLDRCPYYSSVPKDYYENLSFRARVIEDAQSSPDFRRELWLMCRRDPLFWFNVFVWTLDPRLPAGRRKCPFITYEFQDYCILDLLDSLSSQESRAVQKCRDMGLTWMCLGLICHQWQFTEDFSAGLSSRDYECVVNSGDDAALFTRLEFIRDNQPSWLVGEHTALSGRWRHLKTGSSISGEQTTDNMFRAGRLTVAFMDEFAFYPPGMDDKADKASANVTETRWFVSTPNGGANCFAQKCRPKKGDPFAPVVRRYEWQEHPLHVVGLYRSDRGRLIVEDHSYRWPEDYPFVLDGMERSAWYDKKCSELGWIKAKIAEELDGDFAGSGDPVFDTDELLAVVRKYAQPPLVQGDLMISDRDIGEPGDFLPRPNGPFKLWVNLDSYGRVEPHRKFVIGCDVSKGRGYSNDALCIWDRDTWEKVAQYVDCELGDYKLAELAVAAAKVFNGAQLIWELDGGATFYKRIEDLGYTHIYFRDRNPDAIGGGGSTNVPGWKASVKAKEQTFKQYVHAMISGRVINRDESSVMECGKFKYKLGGGIVHEDSEDRRYPSRAGANHGDVVTGDMLAVHLLLGSGELVRRSQRAEDHSKRINWMKHPDPPPGSAAWRYHRAKNSGARRSDSTAVFCTD